MKDFNDIKADPFLQITREEEDGGTFIGKLGASRGMMIIFSFGEGWEHASAHVRYFNANRKIRSLTPTWDEMCWLKDRFWNSDETVIQYHPATESYVNLHNHVLHLWRPLNASFPIPPTYLV